MKTKRELLADFKSQVLKGVIGIMGYGISFDSNRHPYIFINVKSRDFDRLSAIIPKEYQNLPVKLRIIENSTFLRQLVAH